MHSIGKILVRPFGGGKTDRLAKKADGGEMVLGGLKMAGWNVLMMILAYVSGTCRRFAGKDHISHEWEKEIIDSKVPLLGGNMLSSQEGKWFWV